MNETLYTKEQVEQINKYSQHQHFLGEQGKPLVSFKDWINDKSLIL